MREVTVAVSSIFFIFLSSLSSCIKSEYPCPEVSTHVVTLKDSAIIAGQISNYYLNTNLKYRPCMAMSAWTKEGIEYIERGFIKFNLSSIPKGANIQKAVLTLYADTTTIYKGHQTYGGSNTCIMRRVITPWNETTITWNTEPVTTSTGEVGLLASMHYNQSYKIDITNFIREDVMYPQSAHGYEFRLIVELIYRTLIFATSWHPDSSVHPELEITYTK